MVRQELPGYVAGSPAFSHQFGYDQTTGRLATIVNGNGVSIHREYDAAGRLKKQWADPSSYHSALATKEEYDYGPYGHVTRAQTFAGSPTGYSSVVRVNTGEDQYGRNANSLFDFGAAPLLVTSDFVVSTGPIVDDYLARRGLRINGALQDVVVDMQLDALGRTWQYDDGDGTTSSIARYRYAGSRVRERQQGKATGTAPWLLSTDYGWDALRRLASIETSLVVAAPPPPLALSLFEYEHDLEGHVKKRKRSDPGQATEGGDWFKLDEYYRLAGCKLGVDATQYGNAYNTNADFDAVSIFQRHIDYSPAGHELDKAQNRQLKRVHRGADRVGHRVLGRPGKPPLRRDRPAGWRSRTAGVRRRRQPDLRRRVPVRVRLQ